MKKVILIVTTIAILSSCGSSINNDAQKAAKLSCKAQKMALEAIEGKVTLEESMELATEASQFYQEMEGKYDSVEDLKKFTEIYNKEFAKCK